MKNPAIPEAIRSAEASVLGGIFLRPDLLRDLELEAEDFGHWPHRLVFMAMRNIEARGEPIDVVTVENEVEKLGKLDAIGGVAFLGELCLKVPTTDNVQAYAKLTRDQHLKRKVVLAMGAVIQMGTDADCRGEELLAEAQQRLGRIDGNKPDPTSTIGDLASRRFAEIERFAQELAAGRRPLTGAPTGVEKLDAKIGGWQFGIVNLIAARPGMGKSALGLSTADASSFVGVGIHVFTLEDSWHAYTDRQLARVSRVSQTKIRRADLNMEDVGNVYAAMLAMRARSNWIVDDRGGLSAQEIIRAVRRAAAKNGTRVVLIDYLNLVKRNPALHETHALGEIMQAFAEAAKADDMAWVVMAQLNRDLEKRDDKRPTLSDLRGSGEIEEKCKLAVGLYRGATYGGSPVRDIDWECKECPRDSRDTKCPHGPSVEEWQNTIQLRVMKGGNGPTGTVYAEWHGPTTRVS